MEELPERPQEHLSSAGEIRRISEAYTATINRATQDIKVLVRQKEKLEKSYEQLLSINEGLVQDLGLAVQRYKSAQQQHDAVLRANDELFAEAQRLTDLEAQWNEDKAQLEAQLKSVEAELVQVKEQLSSHMESMHEAAERQSRLLSSLRADKSSLTQAVTQLEADSSQLQKHIDQLEEEREDILTRKELVAGENMQLIVELEELRVSKNKLSSLVSSLKEKCHDLEQENERLRRDVQNDRKQDKVAELVEKNKSLTQWREQLVEKNQLLQDENRRLKEKCGALEELLNEEETDISAVIELIRSVQLASKPGSAQAANLAPISPMSAVAAKLRKYN